MFYRHVGDLSNIMEDESGEVVTLFTDDVITLNGGQSIIGRATVVSSYSYTIYFQNIFIYVFIPALHL